MHTYYNTSWLLLRLLVGGNKTAVHLYEYMSVALFKKNLQTKILQQINTIFACSPETHAQTHQESFSEFPS